MKTIKTLLFLCLASSISINAWANIEGLLFFPKVLSNEIEATPADQKITIQLYKEPSATSPVVASISRAGIKDTSGKEYGVPEFRYEEKALPVIQRKGAWHQVGLLTHVEPASGFPEKYDLVGWTNLQSAEFQSLPDFLKSSMVSIKNWDQVFYKTAGGSEKAQVMMPIQSTKGTVKLKPEILKKTGVPCDIPFFADSNRQKLIGICPQNFSFLRSIECEGPKDPSNIFCSKIFVFEEANGLYRIAFTRDLVQFRKNQLDMKVLKPDPNFELHYIGWVEKSNFGALQPASAADLSALRKQVFGDFVSNDQDVEVLESKTVQGKEWVRVKAKTHCGDSEKSFGEGWLPVRKNNQIQFTFVSRGC